MTNIENIRKTLERLKSTARRDLSSHLHNPGVHDRWLSAIVFIFLMSLLAAPDWTLTLWWQYFSIASSLAVLAFLFSGRAKTIRMASPIAISLALGISSASLMSTYLIQGSSEHKLLAVCAGISLTYLLLDWRICTLVAFVGAFTGLATTTYFFNYEWKQLNTSTVSIVLMTVAISHTLSYFAATRIQTRRVYMKQTIGILAHELRTPLHAMEMMTQALINLTTPGQKNHELATKLTELIQSTQVTIDIQQNNSRSNYESAPKTYISLSQVIDTAIKRFFIARPELISSVLVSMDEEIIVHVNSDLFASVIKNLLSNSVRSIARKTKGQNPAIGDIITARIFDGMAYIDVIDKGQGIKAVDLPNVFNPFFSSSNVPAHGMGLTMVRNVMHSLGGQVTAKSVWDEGAIFTLTLPGRRS